jgi:hypothetical protein
MKTTVYLATMKLNGSDLAKIRGEHLVNFDADHSEVVGISGTLNKLQTFDLALENIQTVEQEQKTATR